MQRHRSDDSRSGGARLAPWVALALLGVSPGALAAPTPPGSAAAAVPMGVPFDRVGYEEIAWQNGIRVFKHRASRVIRLGADGSFPARPEQVLATLLAYDQQVEVIDRLSEARVLYRKKQSLQVYQRLNLPVIDDRDFVLQVNWGRSGDVSIVRYHALQGARPEPRRGVVRVLHHVGTWQLRWDPVEQRTQARFQVSIDMAGDLPWWLAKAGAGKELPALFGAIHWLIVSRPPAVTASR